MNPRDLNAAYRRQDADTPWLAPSWCNGPDNPDNAHAMSAHDADMIVRTVSVGDIKSHDVQQWCNLADATPGDNPFAEPWMMLPALQHYASQASTMGCPEILIVQHADGPWIGIMPVGKSAKFGRLPVSHRFGWHVPNQFLGTPLVRPGTEHLFWQKILSFIDNQPDTGPLLHITNCAADSPVVAALSHICEHQNRPLHITSWHDRAAFAATIAQGTAHPVRGKDHARLRTLSRRLEAEFGPVMVHTLAPQTDCTSWIDAFLELEAKGWKGKSGSALSQAAASAQFFRDTMTQGHVLGRVKACKLTAGDTLVAMNWQISGANAGFGFKMAFDETYAAYAPGLLLLDEVCRDVETMPLTLFDSCASPKAQYLNRRWKGRRRIVNLAIGIGKRENSLKYLPFHMIMASISTWHRIKSTLYQLRGAWRR